MLDRIKGKFNAIKKKQTAKKEERIRLAKERAEEIEQQEIERMQAEKKVLMAMDDKELMVEAIIALRGRNTRLLVMEAQQEELESRIDSIESDISSLEWKVSDLQNE